jgi:hypothetical protein
MTLSNPSSLYTQGLFDQLIGRFLTLDRTHEKEGPHLGPPRHGRQIANPH